MEHVLVGGGDVCLTVVDTNSQNQPRFGSRDGRCPCEAGTRSNRFVDQDGEWCQFH